MQCNEADNRGIWYFIYNDGKYFYMYRSDRGERAGCCCKEYKSQVVAELENSNFNPGVIDACKKKAAEDGYELEISDCVYDAWQNMRAAQVALKYHYRIPVLGIYEENITYAIAR